MRCREHPAQEGDPSDAKRRVGCCGWHPLVVDLPCIAHILIARCGKDAEIDVEQNRFVGASYAHALVMILGRQDHARYLCKVSRGHRGVASQGFAREACTLRLVVAPTRDVNGVMKKQRQEHDARSLTRKRAQLLDAGDHMVPRVIVPPRRLICGMRALDHGAIDAAGPIVRQCRKPLREQLIWHSKRSQL